MKLKVQFKDPDTFSDSLSDATYSLKNQLMEELKISEEAAEIEAEQRMSNVDKLASKFIEWGEYITVEFDDETMTAKVLPRG